MLQCATVTDATFSPTFSPHLNTARQSVGGFDWITDKQGHACEWRKHVIALLDLQSPNSDSTTTLQGSNSQLDVMFWDLSLHDRETWTVDATLWYMLLLEARYRPLVIDRHRWSCTVPRTTCPLLRQLLGQIIVGFLCSFRFRQWQFVSLWQGKHGIHG